MVSEWHLKSLLLWNQRKNSGWETRVKISFHKLDSTYIWLYDHSAAKRTLQTPFFLAQWEASPYVLYTDIHKHIQTKTKTYRSIQYIFTKCLLTKALLNFEWHHWHLTSWPSLPPKWGFLPKKPQWHLFKKPHWKQPPSCFVDKGPTQKSPGVHWKMLGKFSRENQPMHLSTTGRDISRKALFLSLGFQDPLKISNLIWDQL